ncbi:actin-like [Rhinatrema bivittatum]|uniref:actin-like n=1 Tax=Rhinatrema bivittatum TaxID=194408 RepID=UPI00112BF1E1|nr:actin-like [Rhinatrema bivittatum]
MSSCNSPTNYKDLAAIVIDTGTGYTKSGFSGDEKPRSILKTAVGVPKVTVTDVLYYIGDNIPKHCASVEKRKVMTYGIVTDWEALEMLWHHIFYLELSICPEELAVLVTDVPMSPLTNREKTAELLFENFGVPAMYISHQSLLSLYSCGRVSGLVVETGYGTSYTTPVDDGYILPHATYRLDLAGDTLTRYLAKLMAECGNPFYEDEMDLVCDIKEKCCYVTSDYDTELQGNEKNYLMDFTLPDGHVISIGSERFRCPEILFNPTALGLSDVGIHVQAMTSVQKCEPEQQAKLLANVVVCGGSSLFHGFPERIKKELSKQVDNASPINVLASQHRKFSAWLGGSVTASLDSFQSLWIDRSLYNEKGPSVVYRHCF